MTPALAPVSAPGVSRILRRAGLLPVPNEQNRRGLKVTRGLDAKHVTLNADLNTEAAAQRMMTAARATLEAAGYTVEVYDVEPTLATVTKPASAAPTLDGHPHREAFIAVETGDRLVNRAYRAAYDNDGITVRRAMAALMDVALTLPPEPGYGMFAPAHRAALDVIQAFLHAGATQHRMPVAELADPDTKWAVAVDAYATEAAEFSATHVRNLAFSDEIAAAARDNVRAALHLTEETR